jgi:hypothetical protein
MADPTRSFEIARFAYGEVLDATKHQDDKIGRILAAVAFLTGGALVFANAAALNTVYRVGSDHFRVTAIFLGVFLFFDLLAVVLYILTVMTPLTYPGTVSGSRARRSHIFFFEIAKTPKEIWKAEWLKDDKELEDAVKEELIGETYNLGKRAAQKNQRSQAASAFFLASVLYLVPAVVLALDTISQTRGTKTVSMDWALARRFLVGAPVAGIVLILILWAWAHAHAAIDKGGEDPESTSKEPPEEAQDDARRRKDKKRSSSLGLLVLAYPLFVGACIVSNGHRSVWASGVVVVALSGVVVAVAAFRLYAATSGDKQLARPPGAWIAGTMGLGLTAAAVGVIAIRSPGLQLVIGMLAATLVLADNLIRVPFRVTDPAGPGPVTTGMPATPVASVGD